jgi:hypothetical protein
MKRHPDGTVEGTPEELARYERARGETGAPVRRQPPTVPGWIAPLDPDIRALLCASCRAQIAAGKTPICGCVRPTRDYHWV